jgi:signal transduction histidine kinase
MSDPSPHGWPAVRAGWATMTRAIRVLVVLSVPLGLAALAAVAAEPLLSGDAALWAANIGWTLGGLVALTGTLAAALRRERGSAVRGAWLLWTAAAACWVAGSFYRDVLATGVQSLPAALLWLSFTVLAISSYARRLPRALIFGIFLLDALPVVLLIVAVVRVAQPAPPGTGIANELFLILYPALFGLCAANAVQMAGIHRDMRHIPVSVLLFTVGFGLMAVAGLFWAPAAVLHASAQGHPTDGLWTLGLVAIGSAGLARAFLPAGALILPTVERESGPHALPPAAAVLGLIIMMAVVPPGDRLLIQTFLLASALALFARVYLIRREDVRLLAALVRSQKDAQTAAMRANRGAGRLRLLADITARLTSLVLDELMQAICDAARELLDAKHAAFGLVEEAGGGFARFVTSGMSEAGGDQMAGLTDVPKLLDTLIRAGRPVRLSDLGESQASAILPAPHPGVGSFLGMPVPIDSSRKGVLYLAGKEGGFDDEDETLAQLLAANVGSKMANAELYAGSRAQQALLTAQNEQLRELDRMKDEFIAVVSHELRTPLTSIIGYLELLEDPEMTELDEQQRRFTTVMHRNADRLLRVVGDLLFLAGLQTGELAIEHGQADVFALARSAIEAARSSADQKHITLTCAPGLVPAVPGDEGRLAQLLDNLISNALKFTRDGGEVNVTVGVAGNSVVVTVSDTGLGMSPEDQRHIFERFFRAEVASDRAIQGLGLGLTIVKAIVDAHGGTIAVQSEPGRGTIIRVSLPLEQAPAGNASSGMSRSGGTGPEEPAAVRVAEQSPGGR